MDCILFLDAGSEASFLSEKAVEFAEAGTPKERGRVLEDVASRRNGYYGKFCQKMKIPYSSADRMRKLYKGSLARWQQ